MADTDSPILLYDGDCSFCTSSVWFFVDRERGEAMRFASTRSDVGRALLDERGLDADTVNSMVLIEGGRVFVRSTAVLRAARYLRNPWSWLAWFRFVPRFVRDAAYKVVARVRHRLPGSRDACRVPSADVRARFLDVAGGV